MTKINRLFLDIETSPNIGMFWRAGYKQTIPYDNIIQEREIICICAKWEGSKMVHAVWQGMDEGANEKAILEMFLHPMLGLADEVVYHNGDRFDMPWIRTRALIHGIEHWPEPRQVDTLKWAKKKFYFNSNRLDYLGQILTGDGKIKTEFGMWRDILLKKCPKAMAKMVRYCKQDVKKLEDVYNRLAAYMEPQTHVGVLSGQDKWTSPFTGKTNVYKSKRRVTAKGTVQHQMLCKDTGRYYTISDSAYRVYQEHLQNKL